MRLCGTFKLPSTTYFLNNRRFVSTPAPRPTCKTPANPAPQLALYFHSQRILRAKNFACPTPSFPPRFSLSHRRFPAVCRTAFCSVSAGRRTIARHYCPCKRFRKIFIKDLAAALNAALEVCRTYIDGDYARPDSALLWGGSTRRTGRLTALSLRHCAGAISTGDAGKEFSTRFIASSFSFNWS